VLDGPEDIAGVDPHRIVGVCVDVRALGQDAAVDTHGIRRILSTAEYNAFILAGRYSVNGKLADSDCRQIADVVGCDRGVVEDMVKRVREKVQDHLNRAANKKEERVKTMRTCATSVCENEFEADKNRRYCDTCRERTGPTNPPGSARFETDLDKKILDSLEGGKPLTADELVDLLGERRSVLRPVINKLLKKGAIEDGGEWGYALPAPPSASGTSSEVEKSEAKPPGTVRSVDLDDRRRQVLAFLKAGPLAQRDLAGRLGLSAAALRGSTLKAMLEEDEPPIVEVGQTETHSPIYALAEAANVAKELPDEGRSTVSTQDDPQSTTEMDQEMEPEMRADGTGGTAAMADAYGTSGPEPVQFTDLVQAQGRYLQILFSFLEGSAEGDDLDDFDRIADRIERIIGLDPYHPVGSDSGVGVGYPPSGGREESHADAHPA
jgi:hypothetical protein